MSGPTTGISIPQPTVIYTEHKTEDQMDLEAAKAAMNEPTIPWDEVKAKLSISIPTVAYTPPPVDDPRTWVLPDPCPDNCIKTGVIRERMSMYQRIMKFFRDRAKEGDW